MSATGAALAAADLGCSAAGPGTAAEPGAAGTSQGAAAAAPSAPHADLEEATIGELAARMKSGELTAEALVAAYSERIDALDRKGPSLRAVIELNPDAPAIAKALDEERRAKGPRGPLHGIPVLLKDNIDTGDRMRTTAGSLALADAPAPADAPLVARLRQAGAVILGKANLSEWANIRSDRSTSGWSARGGLVRNPYALDRNTSGSSSGCAAAAAASLCAVTIGTETDGSIVSPSSICGIVGLKPTVGLVSRTGIIPIAHSQDTAGPMTRTVTDAALLLAAIAGHDPKDVATAPMARQAFNFASSLDYGAARGKRIGVVRGWKRMGPAAGALFETAVLALKSAGAEMVDGVELGALEKIDEPEMEVLLTELKADLATYLAARGASSGSLVDLVAWNAAHAKEELRWFGQELFEQACKKGDLGSPAYQTALSTCRKLARDEGIDAALAKHKLDLLVAPTGGLAWMTDLVNGDSFTGSSSTPAAVAGYPSITVPAGHAFGLPFGVSFFGPAWSEPMLLGVAFAFEQQVKARRKPTFPATVNGLL
jgi:amidase